jgi:hypothetical protein
MKETTMEVWLIISTCLLVMGGLLMMLLPIWMWKNLYLYEIITISAGSFLLSLFVNIADYKKKNQIN